MATQADVRRLALALPSVQESSGRFAFSVRSGAKDKAFAWVWLQRIEPKKARVPCADVLAVRVANNDAKEMLLLAAPGKFFTEPHYNGYPVVLVRLKEMSVAEMGELLRQAWEIQAPKTKTAAKAAERAAAAPKAKTKRTARRPA